MKHFITLLLLYCCISLSIVPKAAGQSILRNFTTLAYNQQLQNNGNNLVPDSTNGSAYNEQIENIVQIERQTNHFVRFNSSFYTKTIPVVFHVLYYDTSQYVSETQIEEQLSELNNHFSFADTLQNDPNDPAGIYADRAVDTQIRFCLATQDGNGSPLAGIQYVPTTISSWKDTLGFYDQIKQSEYGANPIDPEHLLNIWIAALPAGQGGFSQMPGRGSMATDGVVINYRYVGMTDDEYYGQGKTLTFLVAQYLNLYPLSGHLPGVRCSDDFVDDTPRHNSRNSGCPDGNHVSTCDSRLVPEMLMNFMSANTSDGCKYMFTRGQAARMHAVLDSTGYRSGLTLEENPCTENLLDEALAEALARHTNNKVAENTSLKVYPNPARSELFITLSNLSDQTAWSGDKRDDKRDDNSVLIELINTAGKVIKTIKQQTLLRQEQLVNFRLDISAMPSGLYLIKLQTKDQTFTQKVTIEQ